MEITGQSGALLAGILAVIPVVLTSFRKRQDVSVEELETRNKKLVAERDQALADLDEAQAELLACQRKARRLERQLAALGGDEDATQIR